MRSRPFTSITYVSVHALIDNVALLQISMSVLSQRTSAVITQCALTLKVATTVPVSMDMMETGLTAQVSHSDLCLYAHDRGGASTSHARENLSSHIINKSIKHFSWK